MQIKGGARKLVRAEKKKAMLVAYRSKDSVDRNYMKYLKFHIDRVHKQRGLNPSHIMFLLFAYDLEFFTIRWMSEAYGGVTDPYMVRHYIKPLERAKYISVVMNQGRLTDEEKQIFGTGHQLKKYTISQAGRNFVQRFYRELESGKKSLTMRDDSEV